MRPKTPPEPLTLADLHRQLDGALLAGGDTKAIRKAIQEATPKPPEPEPEPPTVPAPPDPAAIALHTESLATIQAILARHPLPEEPPC